MPGVHCQGGDGFDRHGGDDAFSSSPSSPDPGEDQRDRSSSSERADNDGTSRTRGRWWRTLKQGFVPRYYTCKYKLTCSQRKTLAALMGIPEKEINIVKRPQEHGHPVSACLRDLAETAVMARHRGVKVLDVGGSVLRHAVRGEKFVHCCHSGSEHWVEKMKSWLGRLPPGVKVEEKCASRKYVTYCFKGVEGCHFTSDVSISVDSLYYFDEESMLKRTSGKTAYSIFHHYPKTGTYLGGEHNVTVGADGLVEVKISGATEVYKHKQPELENKEIKVGSRIWSKRKIHSYDNYYVFVYEVTSGKSKPSAPQSNKERKGGKKQEQSKTEKPNRPERNCKDLRIPGQITASPSYPVNDGDIRVWVFKTTYESKCLVLEPLAQILSTEVNTESIKNKDLLRKLYNRYEDLARQFNLIPQQYAAMKKPSVVVAVVLGLINDLAIPRNYYPSLVSRLYNRWCVNALYWLAGRDIFDLEYDTELLRKAVYERNLDMDLLDRVVCNVYGVSSFQIGVQEMTATAPHALDWSIIIPTVLLIAMFGMARHVAKHYP